MPNSCAWAVQLSAQRLIHMQPMSSLQCSQNPLYTWVCFGTKIPFLHFPQAWNTGCSSEQDTASSFTGADRVPAFPSSPAQEPAPVTSHTVPQLLPPKSILQTLHSISHTSLIRTGRGLAAPLIIQLPAWEAAAASSGVWTLYPDERPRRCPNSQPNSGLLQPPGE